MSLQFIMGPSGSGKSHYLYEKVTEESLQNPNKNYFVIVPDQSTFQAQKDLVMASPRKGIMNVDVLSFNRLAHRIFEETGGNPGQVLSDVGKSFVLRKIAEDYESELNILKSNMKKTGFIGELKAVISEFIRYDISDNTLEQMMSEVGSSTNLYYKLKDIHTIYQGFRDYLQGRYVMGEELLDLLCRVVPKSTMLKDSVVVLDGFTRFTPVESRLLGELLSVCEKVMVTVTVSPHKKTLPLFDLSDKMIDSLAKIAKESHVDIEAPVQLYEQPVYRFRENEALGFLESHLFRYTRETFNEKQEQIQIFSGKNPKEEMDFVAQTIRRLVRTEGMHYSEIAVITSDMGAYADHTEKIFANYDIPVFMDHKRSILLNSFVEYLRSLLAMAEQNFTYESVFRYLRTDLTGFTREEVDLLENYCVALGIRGYKKWQETWIRRSKGLEEEELAVINDIRKRFVQNIETVMNVLKSRSKTVESVTKALHQFLLDNQLQQRVKAYEDRFEAQGELALAKEYAQVYKIVMELFDQFVELLGDEKLSIKEYGDLLDAGLEEAKVGIIPPSLDQVVVGDIERTRIKDVKVLFFVGINDSYIPGKANAGGLLSERDRERFEEKGITLAPSAKEKSFIQKFYLYLILTKPSKQVVLTYSRATSEGGSLRPAYLIMDLQKLYPQMKVQKIEQTVSEREFTKRSGIAYLVEGLQNKHEGLSREWQELYSWYKSRPEWSRQIEQIVEAAFYHKPSERLTKEVAEKLYGTLLSNSVSRLERFSACAYAHFLTYGLRLQEREVYQFQAVDLGNLFHGAMERFSKKMEQEGYTWVTVNEDQKDRLIEESVEECIVDYGNTILYSTARNEYMITRLKRMMRRTVWALTKQLEKGDFLPSGYEIVYDSGSIPLEEYNAMRLYGKIDRVDVCETEDQVYVKVIDYKTGVKAFDLGELYHGLQMQLVIYMNAAMELERKKHPDKMVIPAGMFYYQMKDPIIDKGEELLKALRPDGIVNASAEVLEHLEHGLVGQSLILPIGRNKDGSLSKTSKVLREDELQMISQFAERKTKEIGERILQGEVEVSPYVMGDRTGCSFCPYKGICGFDEKIPGYEYRNLGKISKEEALESMREEAKAWESNLQENSNK